MNSWLVQKSQKPVCCSSSGASSTQSSSTSSDESYEPTAGSSHHSRLVSHADDVPSPSSGSDNPHATAEPLLHQRQLAQPPAAAKQAPRHQRSLFTVAAGKRQSELPPPQNAAKRIRFADAAGPQAQKTSGGMLPGGIIPRRPMPPPPLRLPEGALRPAAAAPCLGSAGRRADLAARHDIDDPLSLFSRPLRPLALVTVLCDIQQPLECACGVDLPLPFCCSHRMGHRRRPHVHRSPADRKHKASRQAAPPPPQELCAWGPPPPQLVCKTAAAAGKRAMHQQPDDDRHPKRVRMAADTGAGPADGGHQTLPVRPAALHSRHHMPVMRSSGGSAAGSQLGRLSTQSGAAPSSQQPSSVQQQAAHGRSSMASADEASARVTPSHSKQAPHDGVCVVNPRASLADAAADVAATLPPLPKAAGHSQAFGSEHRLLGLMRRHGSFAAKFMEDDYMVPTCQAAELPLLPHVDFAAPSANAQELVAAGDVAADLPLLALQEQVIATPFVLIYVSQYVTQMPAHSTCTGMWPSGSDR